MILYYAPGACSLASHIALHEADLAFDRIKVNLASHRTENGEDYAEINPKGYIPALKLDDGQILTENVAILSWIADQAPNPPAAADLGRYRLLETLAFISTEIHKAFKPFFSPGASDHDKAAASQQIGKRLTMIAENLDSDYLNGAEVSVADAYLFVMLMWAQKQGLDLPEGLAAYYERMKARPAVGLALEHEGLD